VASPKLTIAAICVTALSGTVGVALWESGRQQRNGRAGLRERAVRFSDELDDAAQGRQLSSLLPWLEASERNDAAALRALDGLAVAPRRRLHLTLANVRLGGDGHRGQAEYLLTSPDRGASGGRIVVDWVRAADGTWFLDLVGS